MYEDIDFYSVSHGKKKKLVNNKRVASNDSLLYNIPDEKIPVRIFEKSLEELILDILEKNNYTIEQLADEFQVKKEDINDIIQKYRHIGNNVTENSSKLNLLRKRNGVIRVKNTEGSKYYYTLEKIPFFVRAVDPTLLFSLHEFKGKADEFPELTGKISKDEVRKIDRKYSEIIGDFWEIESEKVINLVSKYDRKYIETTLFPLPVLENDLEYEEISSRLKQISNVYERSEVDSEKADEIMNYFSEFSECDIGFYIYQAFSIDLAHLKWCAEFDDGSSLKTINKSLLNTINESVNDIFNILNPECENPEQIETSDEISYKNISIDRELLDLLSFDLQNITHYIPDFPAHEVLNIKDGKTVYKNDKWWRAVILYKRHGETRIGTYLWVKKNDEWKRKQKYAVRSPEDWEKEKEIIEKFMHKI